MAVIEIIPLNTKLVLGIEVSLNNDRFDHNLLRNLVELLKNLLDHLGIVWIGYDYDRICVWIGNCCYLTSWVSQRNDLSICVSTKLSGILGVGATAAKTSLESTTAIAAATASTKSALGRDAREQFAIGRIGILHLHVQIVRIVRIVRQSAYSVGSASCSWDCLSVLVSIRSVGRGWVG